MTFMKFIRMHMSLRTKAKNYVFGFLLGVILGANFETILLLGRPCVPQRAPKERVNQQKKKVRFWMAAGGGGATSRWNYIGRLVTPLRLVRFGIEIEVSLERGALS